MGHLEVLALGEDRDLAAGVDGSVLLAGTFTGSSSQLGFTADALDGFALRLDQKKNVQWVRVLGGPGDQRAASVAVDAIGAVVIGGACAQAVDFGDGTIDCTAGEDALAIKLAPRATTAQG